MTLASFISSGTSHAILNGFAFFAFVLWLALGYWTYKDAKRRIEDPLLIGLSTVVGLIPPFLGPFIYMLFRPPEYLEDVRERQLEIKAIEDRIAAADLRCPVCHAEVDSGYLVCPVCTTKLKQACVSCARRSSRSGRSARTARRRSSPRCLGRRPRLGHGGHAGRSLVAVERSLILIKPDAVQRRLAGEILGRIEARGFEIREAKLVTAGRELGEEHYAEHREKPFFGELVEFITSGPTWALVVEGEGAIATLRATIGATDPANAAPGTIRGDLASSMPDNLVHGSDSPASAEREIALWFGV